jgi:2-C-methyl-D-erythritol 4-phosphate cytidylyltransferase
VVLAAAGSGERLGAGCPKAMVEVAGKPLLAWSLDAFARSVTVGRAVIAAPRDRVDEFERVAAPGLKGESLGVSVVAGGAARSQSVANAVAAVPEAEIVAVHDAARPLVTAALIDALVDELVERPDVAGVIAAAALTDTVKRAREPRSAGGEVARGGPTVAKTESRDHLWAAQTPQVFRADALREALAVDPQRLAAATDDATLVEKAGGKVLIYPAPAENLKVTTPHDLAVAEMLLTDSASAPTPARRRSRAGQR